LAFASIFELIGLTFGAYCGANGVGCVAATSQCRFTLISGGGVTLDTSLNLPSGTSCFQPSLQAQDGSFVGMVYPQNGASPFMADFAQSAKLNWSVVGDFQPQIATADGGVIATNSDTGAAITFDATGKATGQMASLPTQSWTGNAYQVGSVDKLSIPPILMATTLWAQAGANPSSSSTASRPWRFVLNWQNDFTFTPDDPQELTNLTTDVTYYATSIKQAALKALQDAYSGVPVTVVEGTGGGDANATVLNHQTITPKTSYGATDTNNVGNHQVDYINNMEDGQWAYSVTITNAQDEATALQQRTDLIAAIGRAIGNTAAHEIAHQFLVACCGMDANPQTDPNALATFNAGASSPSIDPSFWTGYSGSPKKYLHWQDSEYSPTALKALGQCLGGGWRDFHGSSCHQ
jgi:hypothetical protein